MAQITEIVLPDGRIYRPDDWTAAEPLYSRIEVTSGTYQTLTAFSYGIAQSVPGSGAVGISPRNAKITDTNIQGEGGRLPDNEEILIYAMEIEAYVVALDQDTSAYSGSDAFPVPDLPDVSALDMTRLQRDLIVKARFVTTQEQTSMPMSWYPGSTGRVFWNGGARTQASDNASGTVIGNNGMPDSDDRRLFAVPFYVSNGEVMGVDFIAPNGSIGGPSNGTGADAPLSVSRENGRIALYTTFDGFRRRPVA